MHQQQLQHFIDNYKLNAVNIDNIELDQLIEEHQLAESPEAIAQIQANAVVQANIEAQANAIEQTCNVPVQKNQLRWEPGFIIRFWPIELRAKVQNYNKSRNSTACLDSIEWFAVQ